MNWKHSPEAELKEFEPRLKLRRSSIMDGSIKFVFYVSRFKPALNLNQFLGNLRRGSNLLN